jgi:hypothetical protein
LRASNIVVDKKSEIATFDFDEELPTEVDATLAIRYTGQINDKMAGMYRSQYKVFRLSIPFHHVTNSFEFA